MNAKTKDKITLKVELWPIDRLIPYARNPRKNDEQVDRMCAAIREFGFRIPIVARSDGTVVDGHLRLKAAKKLELTEVPVALADELTDTQVKAFRLLANQSANWAQWDNDLLALELEDLVAAGFDTDIIGFDDLDDVGAVVSDSDVGIDDDSKYSMKVKTPLYEPTGKEVALSDCYKLEKTNELIAAINGSELSQDEKDFLIAAAYRHTIFNYQNVAEYYSNASPEMQRLMEQSALVIIDLDKAIENGFCELSTRLEQLCRYVFDKDKDNDAA